MGTALERHLARLQGELRITDKRHQDAMITKETTEFIVKRVTKVLVALHDCAFFSTIAVRSNLINLRALYVILRKPLRVGVMSKVSPFGKHHLS